MSMPATSIKGDKVRVKEACINGMRALYPGLTSHTVFDVLGHVDGYAKTTLHVQCCDDGDFPSMLYASSTERVLKRGDREKALLAAGWSP